MSRGQAKRGPLPERLVVRIVTSHNVDSEWTIVDSVLRVVGFAIYEAVYALAFEVFECRHDVARNVRGQLLVRALDGGVEAHAGTARIRRQRDGARKRHKILPREWITRAFARGGSVVGCQR